MKINILGRTLSLTQRPNGLGAQSGVKSVKIDMHGLAFAVMWHSGAQIADRVSRADPRADPTSLCVLPHRTRSILLVAAQVVDDDGDPVAGVAGVAPAAATLRSYLNDKYLPQTNTQFPVGSVVNYPHIVNLNMVTSGDGAVSVHGDWKHQTKTWMKNNAEVPKYDFILFFVPEYGAGGVNGPNGEAGNVNGRYAIFDSAKGSTARDVAHEIGHLFGLRHPWDFFNSSAGIHKIPDDHDERLMGYGGGTRLIHPEWKMISGWIRPLPPTP